MGFARIGHSGWSGDGRGLDSPCTQFVNEPRCCDNVGDGASRYSLDGLFTLLQGKRGPAPCT